MYSPGLLNVKTNDPSVVPSVVSRSQSDDLKMIALSETFQETEKQENYLIIKRFIDRLTFVKCLIVAALLRIGECPMTPLEKFLILHEHILL